MIGRLRYLRTIRRGELTFSRLIDAAWRRAADAPHQLAWRLPSARNRANFQRLAAFRDRHEGGRCFIMANGPSLARMDLEPLRAEVTFGMNRIYRMRESLGFLPTYLVTADLDTQLREIAGELRGVDTVKFVNYNARALFPDHPRTLLLKETFRPHFARDVRRGVWGGHSVTYTCLQLAFYMGFTNVVLIGKDHYYAHTGVPGQLVEASGDERNHVLPNYYRPGQRWRIPDYKGEEFAYGMARAAFEASGRRVLDATPGGHLQAFEKVDFATLF